MKPKNFPHRRERRRNEAKVRQQAWSALTPKEQLKQLKLRPGNCDKQRKKIERHITEVGLKKLDAKKV